MKHMEIYVNAGCFIQFDCNNFADFIKCDYNNYISNYADSNLNNQ